MKDPAFLFYSKDFYEGTRTMYPSERACYVDLMIFQHQNGPIPDDMQRLTMYCSGIDEVTLKAVLKAKFKQTDKGWINDRLQCVIDERQEYVGKQSENGRIGQFWKKAKALLDNKKYRQLKNVLGQESVTDFIGNNEINKATLEALHKASLKQLAIEDEIVIYDFVPSEFKLVVDKWLSYKKSKRQSYANDESIKAMFNNLYKMSGGDPKTAELIIEQSMGNNWDGLFELKQRNHQPAPKPTKLPYAQMEGFVP